MHFCPHTLTFRLKRPVYRGFKGEGKGEGKVFTLTLPLTPSLFRQESISLTGILWTVKQIVYLEYSYGILSV